MANTLEKIMRDFLWLSAMDTRRDHLVSWEVCCRPKKEGGLDIDNLVPKNIHCSSR